MKKKSAIAAWQGKWQERLELLPEFQKAIKKLAEHFPTLGKPCPPLRWKDGKPLFLDLWLVAPDKARTFAEGSPSQKLQDLCRKFGIAHFIGRKPFAEAKMNVMTNLKIGRVAIDFDPGDPPTDREWREALRETRKTSPSKAEVRNRLKPVSATEIKRQIIDDLYRTLGEQGVSIPERHKRIAKALRTVPQHVKNLLSR